MKREAICVFILFLGAASCMLRSPKVSGLDCDSDGKCGPGYVCNGENKCVQAKHNEDGGGPGSDQGGVEPDGGKQPAADGKDGGIAVSDVCKDCECVPGTELACGVEVGVCRKGVRKCVDGRWTGCEGGVGPGNEICDDLDNDCDGATDGMKRPCSTACGGGEETCVLGDWANCTAPDDCSCQLGDVDRAECGKCGAKHRTCNQNLLWGPWTVCQGEGVCSRGEVESRTCSTDIGECVPATQTRTCGNDCAWGNWGACAGGTPPRDEICDGLDNNCDGLTDNGAGMTCIKGREDSCETLCGTEGEKTCGNDCNWSECGVADTTDECDGADNDCDGLTDEDAGCPKGAVEENCETSCGSLGQRECNDECEWEECIPPEEMCNGADDDCVDGVDNGFACKYGTTQDCTTASNTPGTQSCLSDCSGWSTCTGQGLEVCNGQDDNSNNLIDDGLDPDACEDTCRLYATDTSPNDPLGFGADLFDDDPNAKTGNCCGDDAGEYYKKNDQHSTPACCLHETDCVTSGGRCIIDEDRAPTSTQYVCQDGEWVKCAYLFGVPQDTVIGNWICKCHGLRGCWWEDNV